MFVCLILRVSKKTKYFLFFLILILILFFFSHSPSLPRQSFTRLPPLLSPPFRFLSAVLCSLCHRTVAEPDPAERTYKSPIRCSEQPKPHSLSFPISLSLFLSFSPPPLFLHCLNLSLSCCHLQTHFFLFWGYSATTRGSY